MISATNEGVYFAAFFFFFKNQTALQFSMTS